LGVSRPKGTAKSKGKSAVRYTGIHSEIQSTTINPARSKESEKVSNTHMG
jgi:hypothetical protein